MNKFLKGFALAVAVMTVFFAGNLSTQAVTNYSASRLISILGLGSACMHHGDFFVQKVSTSGALLMRDYGYTYDEITALMEQGARVLPSTNSKNTYKICVSAISGML